MFDILSVDERINVLPYPTGLVQPSELQALIHEVQKLREASLEAQNRQDFLEDKIIILQNENDALKRELEAFQDATGRDIAFDRQRLTRIEGGKEKDCSKITKERAEKIKVLIDDRKRITFSELKGLLKIQHKELLRLAIKRLMQDHPGKYTIAPSQDHRYKMLIKMPVIK